jgi:Asp-tRNA(Asn)/Glu-tRNA(Gln) amidotransferase A subunit family amidase
VDLCATPAVELARLIRSRELSATELLTAVLARIDEVNPPINAIVTLAAEQAFAVAAGLDARAARGSFDGPLHGLPIAVKDLAETAGIRTTFGSPIFASFALTGEQIAAARARHAEIFGRVRSFLADGPYDVLALPTVQVVPFGVEQEWVSQINGEPMATYIDWLRSCSRITVSAHPAVSVPAGLTASGLPVGVQLVGRYGADRRLLEIAAAIIALAG